MGGTCVVQPSGNGYTLVHPFLRAEPLWGVSQPELSGLGLIAGGEKLLNIMTDPDPLSETKQWVTMVTLYSLWALDPKSVILTPGNEP